MKLSILVALEMVAVAMVVVNPAGGQVLWTGNGNAYQVVQSNGISIGDATAEALAMSFNGVNGQLATVTTRGENWFVASLLGAGQYWIDGVQANPADPPAEGWSWATGEHWCFTNWGGDEPNDATGDEHELSIYGDSPDGFRGTWNDERLGEGITGYVVEYELVGPLPDAGMEIWSGNGHKYVVVNGSYSLRSAAETNLAGMPAIGTISPHLATITSEDELDFIMTLVTTHEYWLGGLQLPSNHPIPDEEWEWITGEPWCYTNWSPGEPNDATFGEYFLTMYGDPSDPKANPPGGWNDENTSGAHTSGYIAEYDLCDADLNSDGTVGVEDFLQLLANWGECSHCSGCPGDIDNDCAVTINDFLHLLAVWGPC